MTPREKLLALAERLEGPDARPSAHMMLDVFTVQVPMLSAEDRQSAAKAIRVLVADHAFHALASPCINRAGECSVLGEAAGGDDDEA